MKNMVDELQLRDVAAPMLVRFPDILDNRIEKISNCFKQASEEYGYKAENFIDKLVFEIQKAMNILDVDYEIILVDDRSKDNSWQKMKELSLKNSNIKSVRLSRNFGQHPAIMAGLSQAKGEWIIVMDCDLQDQPKEIVKLYNKAQEGFEVVQARRKNREDNFLKKLSSKVFSKVYGYFTDTKYDNEIANFGIYNKKVVNSILEISDYIKFFPLFVPPNKGSIKIPYPSRRKPTYRK
jgi:dolichol-phosphate mannosyltransferase